MLHNLFQEILYITRIISILCFSLLALFVSFKLLFQKYLLQHISIITW